jgi:hypothetical protein
MQAYLKSPNLVITMASVHEFFVASARDGRSGSAIACLVESSFLGDHGTRFFRWTKRRLGPGIVTGIALDSFDM